MTWRLIESGTHDAFMNMAIDEAIFESRISSFVPNTLRLYRWRPSAVSLGRFQKAEDEVRIENCRKNSVDVVRRITGGGTVYHDSESEVTYSMVVCKADLETENITEVYSRLYAGLVEALGFLGVHADFCGGNTKTCPNLTVKGRKISGSAQSHRKGVVLQHGTLLLAVDLERMFTLLRVPWAENCAEVTHVAKRRITSVRNELGRNVTAEEVRKALVQGFEKGLNSDLAKGMLTSHEVELVERLYRSKYMTEDWNLRGIIPPEG